MSKYSKNKEETKNKADNFLHNEERINPNLKYGQFLVDKDGVTFWKEHKGKPGGEKKQWEKRKLFDEYLKDQKYIDEMMEKGFIVKGKIMMTNNKFSAYVDVPGLDQDVFIDGQKFQNRAVDGDTVLVQIFRTKDQDEKPNEEANAAGKPADPEESKAAGENKAKVNKSDQIVSASGDPTVGAAASAAAQAKTDEKKKQPKGKIVGIVSSTFREREIVCNIIGMKKFKDNPESKDVYYLAPINRKFPWSQLEESKVPQQYHEDKKEGNQRNRYYITKFINWSVFFKSPQLKIVEDIGIAGTIDAEIKRILCVTDVQRQGFEDENGEPLPHVKEMLKDHLQQIDPETQTWKIPEDEIAKRIDHRNKRIFTIDPPTSKDLDDALSIDKISENIYEVGVYIADPSYFVKPDTDLDREAQKRCTTTYLIPKVFPMLPRILCEKFCSLDPCVDRLAFGVIFRFDVSTGELDPTFEPIIGKCVIRSRAKWSYQLVQDILDKKVTSEDQFDLEQYQLKESKFEDMVEDCFMLNKVALSKKKKRLESGPELFDNRDFGFDIDPDTKQPLGYVMHEERQSQNLVAEYMILSASIVAEFMAKTCKDKTIIRANSDFQQEKKDKLNEFFARAGLEMDLTNIKSVGDSLDKMRAKGDKDRFTVLNRKLLTSMNPAKYMTIGDKEPSEYKHYSMNYQYYTHFTSPIRRYSDLVVHRMVAIALEEKENARNALESMDCEGLAELCSMRTSNSKFADRKTERLYHCLLIKKEGPKVYDTLIFDVDARSFNFFIEELNMNQFYRFRSDSRVREATLFAEELKVECEFKKPYTRPKEEGKEPEKQAAPTHDVNPEETKEKPDKVKPEAELPERPIIPNMFFKVYDRVKIKMDVTNDHPMDLKFKMMITEEDLKEYDQLKQNMVDREAERVKEKEHQNSVKN